MNASGFAQRVAVLAAIIAGLLTYAYARAGVVGDPFGGDCSVKAQPIQVNGTPASVTQWEAEAFDCGGEGIAYHQPLAGNCAASSASGGQCGCRQAMRLTEDVRICTNGQATWITNTEVDAWVGYTIQVVATGNYTVELNVAWMDNACCNGSAYYILLDGVRYPAAGSYALGPQAMAGWQSFEWRGKSEPIPMVPGIHHLQIVVAQHYFNWDAVRVTFAKGIEWQQVPVWKEYVK